MGGQAVPVWHMAVAGEVLHPAPNNISLVELQHGILWRRINQAVFAPRCATRRVLQYQWNSLLCRLRIFRRGREREAAIVAGEWHDDVMMGLLDREFAQHPEAKCMVHKC